jgi:hypothetical protein
VLQVVHIQLDSFAYSNPGGSFAATIINQLHLHPKPTAAIIKLIHNLITERQI